LLLTTVMPSKYLNTVDSGHRAMNGRHILLILAHLFQRNGSPVSIEDAVRYLSFNCRYGRPSQIRKMLSVALQRELISRDGDMIRAEFLFDRQVLSPNQAAALEDGVVIEKKVEPMH